MNFFWYRVRVWLGKSKPLPMFKITKGERSLLSMAALRYRLNLAIGKPHQVYLCLLLKDVFGVKDFPAVHGLLLKITKVLGGSSTRTLTEYIEYSPSYSENQVLLRIYWIEKLLEFNKDSHHD